MDLATHADQCNSQDEGRVQKHVHPWASRPGTGVSPFLSLPPTGSINTSEQNTKYLMHSLSWSLGAPVSKRPRGTLRILCLFCFVFPLSHENSGWSSFFIQNAPLHLQCTRGSATYHIGLFIYGACIHLHLTAGTYK